MLKDLAKFIPRDDEVKDLTDLFQTIYDCGYADYKALVLENPDSIGLKLMRFFTLPKTELHNQISKYVSRVDAELNTANEERLARKVEYNLQDASIDKKIDDPHPQYSILSDKSYTDSREVFSVLTIGIEYMTMDGRERVTKYAKTMNIFSNKTPNLYLSLKDKLSKQY